MGCPLLLFIKTFINLRCTKGIGNIGGLEIKISLINLDAAVTGRFIATPTGDSLKSTLSQSGIPAVIRLKFFDVHSQLYLNLIPVLNSGRIELAADRKMIEELRRLERRRRRRYSPRISILYKRYEAHKHRACRRANGGPVRRFVPLERASYLKHLPRDSTVLSVNPTSREIKSTGRQFILNKG